VLSEFALRLGSSAPPFPFAFAPPTARVSRKAPLLKVAELIAMLEDLPLDAEVVIDDASTKQLLVLQAVEKGAGFVAVSGSYNEFFED
jgi:hypothetical protein